MKISKSVITLSILTGLLALIQAGAGLFWTGGGSGPFPFTTLHGQTVQMNGRGIYALDTYFRAPIARGTDAVTLLVAIPLLLTAVWLYRRGSLRGGLLLVGALSYLLYNAASVALGTAYNNLFIVYIAYFSASLFAFILAFNAIDTRKLGARIGQGSPIRGIAILMFVSGLALLAAWLGDIIGPLLNGGVPAIASYTTEITYVFDLGIIAPTCFLTGILLLRRASMGYLLGTMMTITLAVVGLMVATQTLFQLQAGISLTLAEFIGKSGSFMALAIVAVVLLFRFFARLRRGGGSEKLYKDAKA